MQVHTIYTDLLKKLQEKESCMLATVIATRGSTPRSPGTSAIIREGRLLAGTVGGGLAEYRLLQEAALLKPEEETAILQVDLSGKIIRDEDAICGGDMTLLIDAFPGKQLKAFRQLSDDLIAHKPGMLLTLVGNPGEGNFNISRYWFSDSDLHGFPVRAGEEVRIQCCTMLENFTAGAFRKIPSQGSAPGWDFVLLESVAPPPSLFIAGAGHIGKVMTHLGRLLGFEVTVWDYRPEFANPGHLPDASRIVCCKAEEIPDQVIVGKDTWIIIVTHGHRYDGDVLKHFIASEAAYIGMIGSKAKVSLMRDRFFDEGWATPEQWERIYSPIGLGIGAKTVEEIAIAIAAQLVQVKYENEKEHA